MNISRARSGTKSRVKPEAPPHDNRVHTTHADTQTQAHEPARKAARASRHHRTIGRSWPSSRTKNKLHKATQERSLNTHIHTHAHEDTDNARRQQEPTRMSGLLPPQRTAPTCSSRHTGQQHPTLLCKSKNPDPFQQLNKPPTPFNKPKSPPTPFNNSKYKKKESSQPISTNQKAPNARNMSTQIAPIDNKSRRERRASRHLQTRTVPTRSRRHPGQQQTHHTQSRNTRPTRTRKTRHNPNQHTT